MNLMTVAATPTYHSSLRKRTGDERRCSVWLQSPAFLAQESSSHIQTKLVVELLAWRIFP